MPEDNDICAYLRNARGCVEDGTSAAEALDQLLEEFNCDEEEPEVTPASGGGPNKPPLP